jgi:hypothetical protein
MNGVRFDRRRVKVDGIQRQRRVAIMGECPDGVVEDDWIEASVVDFADRLRQLGGNQ